MLRCGADRSSTNQPFYLTASYAMLAFSSNDQYAPLRAVRLGL
jgi:hypothetical protein